MSDVQAPRAHARRSDPLTSQQAAEAVTPGLPELQAVVERIALQFPDGFTDVDLVERGHGHGPSTLRSRRAELTARNIILDSGQLVVPEGHTQRHTVWIHRQFVDNPGPLVEPEPVVGNADRQHGRDMAVQLDAAAKQMRSEGRAMFSDQLTEAARLLRRLSQ